MMSMVLIPGRIERKKNLLSTHLAGTLYFDSLSVFCLISKRVIMNTDTVCTFLCSRAVTHTWLLGPHLGVDRDRGRVLHFVGDLGYTLWVCLSGTEFLLVNGSYSRCT